MQAGEYEDSLPGNSLWEEGDWNRDGDFTTSDLVLAFKTGSYVDSAMAGRAALAAAVDAVLSDLDKPA